MLAHDLRMAGRSLKRNPYLSALMIGALAVGITASMIAITLYHARAGHPMPWKESTLYAVTLDLRDDDPDQGFSRHPEYPPDQVAYLDAAAIYASDIPMRSVMMFRAAQVVTPERHDVKPFGISARVTTADFFGAFDTPFLYGGGWTRSDDDAPSAVVVLSKHMNDKLFGGANSVGRDVVLDGRTYRVTGVIGAWMPRPKFYDLTSGSFDIPEEVYLPFGWMKALKMSTGGSINCLSQRTQVSSFETVLASDCAWLQFWVEFKHAADRDRYQLFVNNYTDDQRSHGRFPRKNNNRLLTVPAWLDMNDVVGDESRMQVVLGLVFLGVCILNTLGLMLAKFLSAAPVAGLRRALGASRMDIIRQHLIEVVAVSLLGGLVGLLLTLIGLKVLKVWLFSEYVVGSDNPQQFALVNALVHMDFSVILICIGLSLLTGILAGLYPAIRIGRLAPATFLKTQ
jgi:putative ABC transport system permease protein